LSAVPARPLSARASDRFAAGFLVALMTVGAFALWTGVPTLCLWITSHLANDSAHQLLLALPLTIAAMGLFGWFLVWLNGLYMRVTGVVAQYRAEEEELGPGAAPRYLRGPLETLLVASLVIAIVAMGVWFFVFAHNPGPGSIW
jgi:hypothetical protein